MLINLKITIRRVSQWATLPIGILFFSSVYAQDNLVINGDMEDMRKMPLPKNMAIDGVRLEFDEDSSFFQPLNSEYSPLAPIAAPGWGYTSYDSVGFSASYSAVGYSRSGTNLKVLRVYRGSSVGYNATVTNAVVGLCRPLMAGKQYEVTFYLKPLSGKAFTNNIGVVLTDERIPLVFQFPQEPHKGTKNKQVQRIQPVVEVDYKLAKVLTDTAAYTKFTFSYTATGGEMYVYIGNLFVDTRQFWQKESWVETPFFGYNAHNSRFFTCFYALDDISVLPFDSTEPMCPNVILDELPDTICLASYYYDTDGYITEEDFSLLAEEINVAPNIYSVIIVGNTDNEGTLQHNLTLSKKRAEFVKTKIENHISKPISIIGLGASHASCNSGEPSKNRRVDVCLVKNMSSN